MITSRCLKSIFSSIFISFLISGLILQGIVPTFGHAASNITSDGTMGTTVTQAGAIYNIDGGTIRGTNQFHSFGLFSVGTGDTASFNGPPVISNIIGRVTGSQQSIIDGILRSTITGANLYLLNPYGILFGPNASLNVSGSFHVSTADYLRLPDGGIFYSNPLRSSVLTTAPPAAFGFLSNSPAPISIQGSSLNVPQGQTLSVVGGDIQIDSGALLKAPHGQINIASVASPGEVIPNLPGQLPALDVSSFANLGQITELGFSNLTVSSSAGAGTVLIRGGRLVMDNSYISANTSGASPGNSLGIDVQLTGDLGLTNMAQMLAYSGGAGRAGDIRIKADSMELLGGSFIYSGAFSSGDSGNIDVTTNSLTVKDGAYIGNETYSTGNSGNLTVNTGSLKVMDGWSDIYTMTYGSGNSGKLVIQADDILISGGPAGGAIVGSITAGSGNCGDLLVTAKNLQILNGSELSSTVYSAGSGNGGRVEVAADRVFISGSTDPNIYTGIFANTFGVGKGGSLSLTANSLEMTNRASLQASTFGTGDAGKITLRVGSLELKDASYVSSTGYYGLGAGNSGNIEVSANRVFISGLENSTQPFNVDATGFFTGSLKGYGGDVYIKTDSLTLTNRGLISSTSYGSGRAGNIRVDAESVELLNGAFFLSSAYGSGNGGKIEVIAESVLVSGVHPAPVSDITGNISLTPSGIGSQAFINGGNAGDVRIMAGTLNILDGARISTQTFGAGNGGNIEVTADNVAISGANATFREFLIGKGIDAEEAGKLASASLLSSTNGSFLGSSTTGNAGNLQITARNVQVQNGGLISSKTDTSGNGGNIEVTAGNIQISDGAVIDSGTKGSGKAGNISLTAPWITMANGGAIWARTSGSSTGGNIHLSGNQIQLFNGASVSAESVGTGNAGDISINAGGTLLMKNSSITTEATQADGGNIHIKAGYRVNLIDSKITASVGGGPQTVGGNITIDPRYVILNNSQIIANAYEGKGGNIRIIADVFLASPESIVDASSALGIDGTVDIQAPIQNISGTLAPLQGNFLSAEALFRDRCIARIRGERISSFVVSGRDGLPIRPGSVLPSPIY
jgi:filamentous hemagglutinin family protein